MSRARTAEPIVDVRRRPGLQRPLVRTFAVDDIGPMGTSSATVPPEGELVLDATLEASGLDVVLAGRVVAPWEGECRRCLQVVVGTVDVDLHEIFSPHAVEGETWPVRGDMIELAPVIHDAVLLSLPLVPLCSSDCVGPDPDRFPATVEGTAAADDDAGDLDDSPAEPPRDPRWSALDQISFD